MGLTPVDCCALSIISSFVFFVGKSSCNSQIHDVNGACGMKRAYLLGNTAGRRRRRRPASTRKRARIVFLEKNHVNNAERRRCLRFSDVIVGSTVPLVCGAPWDPKSSMHSSEFTWHPHTRITIFDDCGTSQKLDPNDEVHPTISSDCMRGLFYAFAIEALMAVLTGLAWLIWEDFRWFAIR